MTTINKNSWHYRLATVYGDFSGYSEESDFCLYSRQVIKGFFMTVIAIIIGAAIGSLYLDLGLWIYFCINEGHFISMNLSGLLALALTIIMAGSTIHFQISEYFDEKRYQEELRLQALSKEKGELPKIIETPPSFFKLLFTKFNNKVCLKLKFK